MSFVDKFLQPEIVELARRVRTEAGAAKYNVPIGSEITPDMERRLKEKSKTPGAVKIPGAGVKPGQQVKTADGYKTVGVTREDRVRKGVIHVYGTDGKLMLTIQSNSPVEIKVRVPEAVELSKVATAAGTVRHGTPVGSTISTAKTPLKSANKAIQRATTNMVKHGRPTFTRSSWHDQITKHVKAAYPGVSVSLRKTPAGHIAVDHISVHEKSRGQGLANKAMKDLVDVADHMGATLSLSPSDGKLTKWYSAWGFVNNDGEHRNEAISEGMHRAPKQPTQAP
jgi:hypothetical protein